MALKPLNSVGGFSVGEIPANVILANADIISNNLTVQKIANLGPVSNVIITGGSPSQYLQTDGLGNLSWQTIGTAGIANGTSNIDIPVVNGNVNTSVGGNANVFVVTGTGANVTGYFTASGNITGLNANLGNLATANYVNVSNDLNVLGESNLGPIGNVVITGGTPGQVVSTDGSGNLSFVTIDTYQIQNGNSNVVVAANSNVTVSVAGNANVLTVTGTGVNVAGTLNTGTGNANVGNLGTDTAIITTGNISTINSGLMQNGTSNLTIASGGNVSTYIGGNATAQFVVTSTGANVAGTANVVGNVEAGGVKTDNLYYANGQPWDFALPAGSNTEIQYNDGVGGFGASANFTWDYLGNVLTVGGNANVTGTTKTYEEQLTSLLPTQIVYGNGSSYLVGSANFTFDDITSTLAVTGSANISNVANVGNLNVVANVTSDLLPNANLYHDLGATTQRWDNVFAGNIDGSGTLNVSGNANVGNIGAEIGVFTGNIGALNANLGNLVTANYGNFTNDLVVQGNIANANNITTTNDLTVGANANVIGNLVANNISTAGSGGNISGANVVSANTLMVGNAQVTVLNSTYIAYANAANYLVGTANFVWDNSTNTLAVTGNANVTGTVNTPNINSGTSDLVFTANGQTATFAALDGNMTFPGNVIASTFYGNIIGNISGNIVIPGSNTGIVFNDDGNANTSTAFTFDKVSNLVYIAGNIDLGGTSENQIVNISDTSLEIRGGYANATNSNVTILAGDGANATNWGKVTVTGNLSGNSAVIVEANQTYYRTPGGAGNAVAVNTQSTAATNTTTGALVVDGGVGISGNVYAGGNLSVTGNIANANNISATNYVYANNANITANLTSGNANLGNLAIANFVETGNIINGNSNITIAPNGNIALSVHGTANVVVANENGVNVVGYVQANGNGSFGAVYSPTVTSNSGALTLSAAAGTNNVILVPTGTGNVDVSTRHITSLADPSNPQDAATKSYVDSVATGLQIHTAVRVTSTTNLNAVYANGGTSLTTIAITGGNTIQFSAAHGLSVDDEIYWTNSFNGIVSQNGYFVESTPASDTITVRATYTGAEVTGLTNGTGLTQAAKANSGVGATLTNNGANAAISIDGVSLSVNNRVLVQGQTNGYENGVYYVSTVGNGSTAWVLTRATDADQYAPSDVGKLGYGDYFFVQNGSSYAGSSYVVTSPTGEIVFGITNIGFSQFAAAGSYSAGSGINIVGTTISANVDNDTTAIVSGNIVVKASANLTTPNIGAATGTSVNLTGNVLANNLNANTKITTVDLEASGNIIAANISANANLVVNNLTVNLELTGNTANFSGNVVVPNLAVNVNLDGNVGNFSGNVNAAFVQAGIGNLIPNLTNPLFAGIANANNYVQAYVYNENSQSGASADFIAYPDNGDDISGWIDMGITSSNFAAAAYSVTGNNEGYVFMSAPSGAGKSGNLVIATDSTGANNSIEFFVNGFNKLKTQRSALIDTSGLSVFGNTVSTGVTATGVGALKAGVTNTILPNTIASFSANVNSYSQVTLQNKSTGADATADYIITADNGSDTVNYLDLGIINSGYDANTPTNSLGNIVYAADGYLYTQGNSANASQSGGNLVIGTTVPGKNVKIFVGGNNNQAIVANIANTGITVTGNANISGNISANNLNATHRVDIGTSAVIVGNVTTSSITADQVIASVAVSGVTGIEWIVKGYDSSGAKYSMAIVAAVTDGTDADYTQFSSVNLGGSTGSLSVGISGSNVELRVTPASSNSTVWVTQFRTI